jgi:hypothetical protein
VKLQSTRKAVYQTQICVSLLTDLRKKMIIETLLTFARKFSDDELVTLSEDITSLYIHDVALSSIGNSSIKDGVLRVDLGEKANMITWFLCIVDAMHREMAERRLHNCLVEIVMIN